MEGEASALCYLGKVACCGEFWQPLRMHTWAVSILGWRMPSLRGKMSEQDTDLERPERDLEAWERRVASKFCLFHPSYPLFEGSCEICWCQKHGNTK